jgi:hypothetical protein
VVRPDRALVLSLDFATEIVNGVEAVKDGRIYIERVNEPFLLAGGGAD